MSNFQIYAEDETDRLMPTTPAALPSEDEPLGVPA